MKTYTLEQYRARLEAARLRRRHLEAKLLVVHHKLAGETCTTCRHSDGAYGDRTVCLLRTELVRFIDTCGSWRGLA